MDPFVSIRQQWGRNVALGRRTLKLSQTALAKQCGVSQQAISDIERGVASPGDWLKQYLAGALHQRVEHLFPLEPAGPLTPGEKKPAA